MCVNSAKHGEGAIGYRVECFEKSVGKEGMSSERFLEGKTNPLIPLGKHPTQFPEEQ